ncbi:MAG: hypothetical protein ACRDAU_09990 [Clostridium sp.]
MIITVGEDKIEFSKDIQQMKEVFEMKDSGFSIDGNVMVLFVISWIV